MMKKLSMLAAVLLCLAALTFAAPAPADSGYKVLRSFAIGGEGGWDYLTFDAATRRLFIARATRVQVVDVDAGKLLGEIPGTNGVHGVAIVASAGRAVSSNGRDNSALIFDPKTLAPVATIKTGTKPDAILYEPFTGLVLTMNGGSSDVTVIDPVQAAVVATIPLPGRPETAVSDGKGKVFINLEDKNSLAVLDMATRKVVATWPMDGCDEPTGLAYDAATARLFSGCHSNTLVVVDAATGRNVQKLTIGAGVDAAAFDANRKLVFTSNGSGSISVAQQDSADQYTSLAEVPTAARARTVALDPEKHLLYTVTNIPGADGKPVFTLLVVGRP
jgi:YVTN family beta-propeller protein